MSSRWFACICRMRPMRSLRSFVELVTCEPARSTPRVDAQVGEPADVGVGHDLERERRERLAVVGTALDVLVLLEGEVALDRRDVERARAGSRTIASSSSWTPLFLNAEPQSTGTPRPASVVLRIARRSSSTRGLLLVDELLHEGLVVLGELLEQLVAGGLGRRLVLGGDLGVLPLLAHVALPVVGVHVHEVDARRGSRASVPHGSWRTSGLAASRSTIISTVRSKLAPVRSILLTKAMRGTS